MSDDLKARLLQACDGHPFAHWSEQELREAHDRITELERERDNAYASGYTDCMSYRVELRCRAEVAEAECEHLRGLLWYAWSEMNAIRAESGVPRAYDGTSKGISKEYWSKVVDAMEAALGDEAQPWPSNAARTALAADQQGERGGEGTTP